MAEYPEAPAAYVPDSKGVYHRVDAPYECKSLLVTIIRPFTQDLHFLRLDIE